MVANQTQLFCIYMYAGQGGDGGNQGGLGDVTWCVYGNNRQGDEESSHLCRFDKCEKKENAKNIYIYIPLCLLCCIFYFKDQNTIKQVFAVNHIRQNAARIQNVCNPD